MKKSSVQDQTNFLKKLTNFWGRCGEFQYWWYRFKWNYYPSLKWLSSAPLHVDIETTDACNLRCIMCVQGIEGVGNTGFIEPELAYRAIDECSELGVYSIKFNYRGEPLLHRDIVEFVRYAKEKKIMEVQFNTNGLPLNKKKIENLIDAGLDRIIFSVDGATSETYENIRVGGNYKKLLRNIDLFIKIKKEKNKLKPFIRVQMVKYYGAENEVDQFISFWNEKGVDNIAVIDKQDRDNKSGYPLRNGQKPIGRVFCPQPFQRLNINRDGKVLMCCGDWDRKTIVGDFKHQSIKEIWYSDKLEKLRANIASLQLDDIPACKTCFRPTTYKWE